MAKKPMLGSPPRQDKEFKVYWKLYIDNVLKRNNFRPDHLQQLKILCDLHVDYENLISVIKVEGLSVVNEGRYGFQVKARPEVAMKKDCVAQIAVYCKLLQLEIAAPEPEDPNDKDNPFVP